MFIRVQEGRHSYWYNTDVPQDLHEATEVISATVPDCKAFALHYYAVLTPNVLEALIYYNVAIFGWLKVPNANSRSLAQRCIFYN